MGGLNESVDGPRMIYGFVNWENELDESVRVCVEESLSQLANTKTQKQAQTAVWQRLPMRWWLISYCSCFFGFFFVSSNHFMVQFLRPPRCVHSFISICCFFFQTHALFCQRNFNQNAIVLLNNLNRAIISSATTREFYANEDFQMNGICCRSWILSTLLENNIFFTSSKTKMLISLNDRVLISLENGQTCPLKRRTRNKQKTK